MPYSMAMILISRFVEVSGNVIRAIANERNQTFGVNIDNIAHGTELETGDVTRPITVSAGVR